MSDLWVLRTHTFIHIEIVNSIYISQGMVAAEKVFQDLLKITVA